MDGYLLVSRPTSLTVRIYGQPVGYISHVPGGYVFTFTPEYLALPNPPTLSRSFVDAQGRPRSQTRLEAGLPGFFENLLPENRLRDYIAARAGVSTRNSFQLLQVVGGDLPGAVTVDPADEPWEEPHTSHEDLDHPLRFSLAGVQLKFSAIQNARGGFTIPVDGAGGYWILKLPPIEFRNLPENEKAALDFARVCGIDVPETVLVPIDEIAGLPPEMSWIPEKYALAVRRFDRLPDGSRVHIEDFNQVFNQRPIQKYDNHDFSSLGRYLARKVDAQSMREFLKRLAFSIAIGNGDMHLKNWSLIYRDRVNPVISPAYDFVPTIAYYPNDDLGMKLGMTKRASQLCDIDLAAFAEKAEISRRLVFSVFSESIAEIRDRWGSENGDHPEMLSRSFEKAFSTVPLLRAGIRPLHPVLVDLARRRKQDPSEVSMTTGWSN